MNAPTPPTRPGAPVLVVEDSDEDYHILMRVLPRGADVTIERCATGAAAVARLFPADGAPVLPRLILLDLNLPGVDGRELLLRIRQDPRLAEAPVVVMTTSTNPLDIRHCLDAGADGYVTKVLDGGRYAHDLWLATKYWLDDPRNS